MSGMISELATQAQMKAIIALLIVPLSATAWRSESDQNRTKRDEQNQFKSQV
jgi:hypothetical protein